METPYYTASSSSSSNNHNNPSFQAPYPPYHDNSSEQVYPVDFFFEPINHNNTMKYTTNHTYQTPTSSMDDDYVQNLSNELKHTKELLKQYQIRTEQLMELVTKQTNKITDLREQLKQVQDNSNNT